MDANATLLIVDDEPALRDSLKRELRGVGLRFVEANDGLEALSRIEDGSVDLVLLDLDMPRADGFFFLKRFMAAGRKGSIPICVMTGSVDPEVRSRVVEAGADDFIAKPADSVELKARISSLLRIRFYQKSMADLNDGLERLVAERTEALRVALENLRQAKTESDLAYRDILLRLCVAAEARDESTAAHLDRIGHISALLAEKRGWPVERRRLLLDAAKMHDIGKLIIPDAILNKPGRLTRAEFEVMESHAEVGHRILAGSKSKLLELAATIALTHHENFDGDGYPQGLVGGGIPEEGRIVAIADMFDALLSTRAYKRGFPLDESVRIMRRSAGGKLDPELLDLFLEHLAEFAACHERLSGGEAAASPAAKLSPASI